MPANLPAPGPAADPEAGVPADGCGPGFVADGQGGCDPVIPADECPNGSMAVPGDAACREVAACAAGTWGDIPVEADTEYVDQSFVGVSTGASDAPWTGIQQAVDAAAPGAIVAVAAGSYLEDVALSGKAVRVWGRCPTLVEIVGTGSEQTVLLDQASHSELHDLAVTGPARGVQAVTTDSVLLSRLWIHDTTLSGLKVTDSAAVTVRGTLVERATLLGIAVFGSSVDLGGVVVRGTRHDPLDATDGRGIYSEADAASLGTLTLTGSVVESSYEFGVLGIGSDLMVDATVIRKTAPLASDQTGGFGLGVEAGIDRRASATVSHSVVLDSASFGIYAMGSDLTVEETTVRRSAVGTENWGGGIAVQHVLGSDPRSRAIVRRSLVSDCQGSGIHVASSDATLEQVLVRDTRPRPSDGATGWGMDIVTGSVAAGRGNLTARSCLVEGNHDTGILALGGDVTVEDSIVRDTLPRGDGTTAMGLAALWDPSRAEPGALEVRRTSILRSHGIGLVVDGGELRLESSVVSDTLPQPADGPMGIGVLASTHVTGHDATVTVQGSVIEHSRAAGIFVAAGATLTMESTIVRDLVPTADPGSLGNGLDLQPDEAGRGGVATIRFSELTGSANSGISAWSSSVVVEGSIVQDSGGLGDGTGGMGVAVFSEPPFGRSTALVRGSIIRRNRTAGVFVSDSDLTVDATVVRETAAALLDGRFGRCVSAQDGATLVVSRSLAEHCLESGIDAIGSTVSLDGVTIRDIAPRLIDGLMGDGISLVAGTSAGPSTITGCRIERAARAGLTSFGAAAAIGASTLECNRLDLDAESWNGPPTLQDLGGNVCGCAGETTVCVAVSTGLEPPDALP